jgi:hypothetical protein
MAYMAQQRVMRARALLTEDDGNTTGREATLWVDGFIAGMRYNKILQEGLASEFADHVDDVIDGNRRQRRSRK